MISLVVLLCSFIYSCQSEIIDLTKENFQSVIENRPNTFVLFYATGCENSKLFIDFYFDTIASAFDSTQYTFAKLNVLENPDLNSLHHVTQFPTIKLYRKELTGIQYEGDKVAEKIITWINKKTGNPSTLLPSQKELDEFLALPGNKIVAKIRGEGKSMKNWLRAAASDELNGWIFGHMIIDSDSESISMYNAEEEPKLFNDEILKSRILQWVEKEGAPLCSELTENIWTKSQERGIPIFVIVLNSLADKDLIKLTCQLGKNYKDKIVASYTDSIDLAKNLGASGEVVPTALIISWPDKVTVFNEETETFSKESLDNFITLTLEKKYKGYRKSDPVPETNDEPVKIIVGKTLEQIAYDPTKHVFVKYYAPWCGHCKSLAPIWTELAEKFADNDKIIIAKFDATSNTLPPEIPVESFPTLILYTTQNKQGLTFQGPRTLEALTEFVKTETHPQENRIEL